MDLSKTYQLALIFMTELARQTKGEHVTISKIASNHHVSVLYLKKIVRELLKSGLITSKEGNHGGYSLKMNPHQISSWDIISALSKSKHKLVPFSGDCPINAACLPQHIQKIVSRSMEQALKRISLNQFV